MEARLTRRSLEAERVLEALDEVGPAAMTSCPGWSAHHVGAHIAGNYEEVRRHVEAFSAGAMRTVVDEVLGFSPCPNSSHTRSSSSANRCCAEV
jgi:hypothetical protein